jgi:hypothetical protein
MDNPKRKRGFATLSPEQLRAVSRKGGSVKSPKGFATMTQEERSDIARRGALAMHKKRKEKRKNEQNSV